MGFPVLLDASSVAEDNNMAAAAPLDATDQELKRILSLHDRIWRDNSWPLRDLMTVQGKADEENIRSFKKIGAGACGVVFPPGPHESNNLAFKLRKANHDDKSLWNDYEMHTLIEAQFVKRPIPELSVPECFFFFRENPGIFSANPGLARAAEPVCHLPTSGLVTERILPLPKMARDLLIGRYCAPRIREEALADPANGECLVRVYLGSNRGRMGDRFFSLRNFKLHLNQILELQMDVERLARRIAATMAVMHWAGKTDARDVEFVLGSSSKILPKLSSEELQNFKGEPTDTSAGPDLKYEDLWRYTTRLWVLDFNLVRRITMDEVGVADAVDAALANDPYIPRPLRASSAAEKRVWEAFAFGVS